MGTDDWKPVLCQNLVFFFHMSYACFDSFLLRELLEGWWLHVLMIGRYLDLKSPPAKKILPPGHAVPNMAQLVRVREGR